MAGRKADAPLSVEIPPPGADHPSWAKVGVITAIGFMVGVAWPRLAGVRLGPSLPDTSSTATASAEPSTALPSAALSAPAAPASAVAATPPAPSASAASAVTVAVGHGVVFACKTADGEAMKGGDCGTLPGLDGALMPRLRKVAECPQVASATGKVHLVVRVDFARGTAVPELGRGQTLAAGDAVVACAKGALADVKLTGIAHDNTKYSVAYAMTFADETGSAAPSSVSPAPAAPPRESAEGTAEVVWEVAIVRDAPKTGKVLARLQRGTSVRVGVAKDGWYPVKYGDNFVGDGWLFRGAIGR